MMTMMIMNSFCGMVDRRKTFSLISNQNHCQRSSPPRISDTPRARFEPAQNLSSGFVEWSCSVMKLWCSHGELSFFVWGFALLNQYYTILKKSVHKTQVSINHTSHLNVDLLIEFITNSHDKCFGCKWTKQQIYNWVKTKSKNWEYKTTKMK